MKKFARITSLLLVCIMLFGLMPAAVSAASPLDGKKILFFGDSLTAFPNGGTDRYSDRVQSAFPNSVIINAGVGGDSTYQARLRFQTDVLDKSPDIVFICFGMNDAAKDSNGNNYKPITTYRRNIQNFINALKAINCQVVLMTPNPVNGERGDYSRGDHVAYCDVLRELAEINDIGLVDMYTVFKQNGYVSSSYIYDGIHQNAAGRQIYADHISAYLNAVYNNQNKATLTVECVTEGGKKIGSYTRVGAIGADIRIVAPEILGYTAVTEPVTTTFSTKTVTLTYTSAAEQAVTAAKAITRSDYAERVLEEIDYYIALGEAETDVEKMAVIAKHLNYLITVKGDTELVYSRNLKYTTNPAPNYYAWDSAAGRPSDQLNPLFVDDNYRLADGSKSNADGYNRNNYCYSVWTSDVDVVFDFGRPVAIDTVRGYFADGKDGVSKPDRIWVYYSNDGVAYTKIDANSTSAVIEDTTEWDTHCFTVKADVFSARYVKVVIDTVSWGAKCAWVDEVEVLLSDTDVVIPDPEPTPDPDPDPEPDPDPDFNPFDGVIGDVNVNGKIDARDYLLLKRAYFGTYTLTCGLEVSDINGNGKIDARDYLLLKRAYFGTYTIQ